MKGKLRRKDRSGLLNAVFAAIADATRRSILDRLREQPLTITELAAPYRMSLNAVSKHIKTLEAAGLLCREIRGREHSCRLNASRMEEAMTWMSDYTEFWSARMEALDEHLSAKRKRERR
ncbi:MAG: metalloregulator ArsR/SmtB family transcription factor [Acidobacteriaceae bacterium]